jgi:hypothetical protein
MRNRKERRRKHNRADEFDESALYEYMEISP